jgi:hypothetical protein
VSDRPTRVSGPRRPKVPAGGTDGGAYDHLGGEPIRVATEWLAAVASGDDATAVRLSAFTADELRLVRRSLTAETWGPTQQQHVHAPGIERVTFIDAATGRKRRLLVQQSSAGWTVLAMLEEDGRAFPRAPAATPTDSRRAKTARSAHG